MLRRRFVSLNGAKPCVFLHIRQFSQQALTHTHSGSHVCDAAVVAATGPRYCCCSETQTWVACAHSFVCVLWNVKSNLPIARLRAENETATGTVRLRMKETIARVGNMHDDCDCAMCRFGVCVYFTWEIVYAFCAVLYGVSSAAMWFLDINSVWKWPSMLVCVSEFSSRFIKRKK